MPLNVVLDLVSAAAKKRQELAEQVKEMSRNFEVGYSLYSPFAKQFANVDFFF